MFNGSWRTARAEISAMRCWYSGDVLIVVGTWLLDGDRPGTDMLGPLRVVASMVTAVFLVFVCHSNRVMIFYGSYTYTILVTEALISTRGAGSFIS